MSVTVAMQVDEENPMDYNHKNNFEPLQTEASNYDENDYKLSSSYNAREFSDKILALQKAVKQVVVYIEDY